MRPQWNFAFAAGGPALGLLSRLKAQGPCRMHLTEKTCSAVELAMTSSSSFGSSRGSPADVRSRAAVQWVTHVGACTCAGLGGVSRRRGGEGVIVDHLPFNMATSPACTPLSSCRAALITQSLLPAL